ncbi:armadillo/beta-catenin/plakoglobin [Rhizoctonia solani AG-1 IA]|uniref:Armadillo/beta-catenin/plakoglobin n=1 Tax=Thanatephorus cucumeris (strain AG1-IA) TaxID=983506 RepID=L8WRI1_THACA|nr:armadillo/beta-catenin/plakoglobin [Rhizoctonia solani AG-1 IA]
MHGFSMQENAFRICWHAQLFLIEYGVAKANNFSNTHEPNNKLLVSHGRPPWYGQDGKPLTDAFVIGIAGESTTRSSGIFSHQAISKAVLPAASDTFCRHYVPGFILQRTYCGGIGAGFCKPIYPDAIDMPLFAQCLRDLKGCRQANVPIYSFTEHQRMEQRKYLYGANIIIVEGIMALQDPQLRDLYDVKIFVQCDSDLMLARRIKRDVAERGRDVDGILEHKERRCDRSHYDTHPQEAFRTFFPVQGQVSSCGFPGPHNHLSNCDDRHILQSDCVTPNPAIKGTFDVMYGETSREDFIFYADRLATLICEKAMEVLPFKNINVSTPTGAIADGKDVDMDNPIRQICSVTIVRAGGMLEKGLRRVMRDIAIGSLLIQSDPSSGEPMLLHSMLPSVVQRREESGDAWVFLLDAQIGTGAAALMAIRVLLDHGVAEDHIIFVTFLGVPRGGMAVIRKTFPGIRFVCGAVDDGLQEAWLHHEDGTPGRRLWSITPGMGNIGDRYYM